MAAASAMGAGSEAAMQAGSEAGSMAAMRAELAAAGTRTALPLLPQMWAVLWVPKTEGSWKWKVQHPLLILHTRRSS